MDNIIKYFLTTQYLDIYKEGSNNAYLLSKTSEYGGIQTTCIDYDIARNISKDEIYMEYSINLQYHNKDQFLMPYIIIEKIVDKNGNIILIGEKQDSVSLK